MINCWLRLKKHTWRWKYGKLIVFCECAVCGFSGPLRPIHESHFVLYGKEIEKEIVTVTESYEQAVKSMKKDAKATERPINFYSIHSPSEHTKDLEIYTNA
jgi:hypothetical protein